MHHYDCGHTKHKIIRTGKEAIVSNAVGISPDAKSFLKKF